MTTLSPLAQRIYDVLARNATTTTYMAVWNIAEELGEEIGLCGVPGPGVEAMQELERAHLVQEVPDLGCRYRLTPLAWQSLLSTERERARQAEEQSRLCAELLHNAQHTAGREQALRLESEHKASQYDSVVEALQVAGGGRYRNDTIEALLARLASLEVLRAELDEANEVIAYLKGQEPIVELQAAVRQLRQLVALRSALEPFVKLMGGFDGREVIYSDDSVIAQVGSVVVRLGDLRRAAEAWAKEGE